MKSYSDGQVTGLTQKLVSAESALRAREDENIRLNQALKEVEWQFAEAQSKSNEAHQEVSSIRAALARKDEELSAIRMKLMKMEGKGGIKHKAEDLEAQLQEKEVHLAMASTELGEKERLLETAQRTIQQLIVERNLLIENSKKWKMTADTIGAEKKSNEDNLKMLIATKENELQLAKHENHNMASMIFNLESKSQQMMAMGK